MPTCQVIVDTALRKLGVVGAGRSARPPDATDTLAALQAMYGAWISAGSFGRLIDVTPTGSTYTPYTSCRIYRQDTMTVILPDLVGISWLYDYGWFRLCGAYNPSVTPRDGMAVVISDMDSGNTASWLFDGHIKKWESIDLMTLADDAPRSSADPQGLASMLAVEISDQFDSTVSDATLMQAARYKSAMTQRFGMRREMNYMAEAYF